MEERPFRLLVVSHAADRTGAPISTLALTKHWATRKDIEVKVLLRRDGPLGVEFEAVANTMLHRHRADFRMIDAITMLPKNGLMLTLKGLRNPDRPYVRSAHTYLTGLNNRACLRRWQPNAIYASTTHCGDAIEPLGLDAPILTHVREMKGVIAALDKKRREFALKNSAGFAAVSQPVKETLTEDWGVDPHLIAIEPPAIDLSVVLKGAEASVPLNPKSFIVGIGSLIPRKGPDLFLSAARTAIAAGSTYDFVWLGEGEMREALETETQKLVLSNRVHWLGQTDNPYPYLKAATALAMTSREDPHPRTMIEAAALGTPIVAFKGSGGAEQFIADNNAGVLVGMEDVSAMAEALTSDYLPKPDTVTIQQRYDVTASAERLLERLKALAV